MKHFYRCVIMISVMLLTGACESKKEPAVEPVPAGAEAQPASKPEDTPRPAASKKVKQADPAFFDAALAGDLQQVESKLAAGVPVDARTPDRQTALMLAAYNGHTKLVETLIARGGDVNNADGLNRTALIYASSGPFTETVRVLIDHGADVNVIDNNERWTALMFAAAEGQAENVKLLLEHGADPAIKDIDGDTAETFAVNNGHARVVQIIRDVAKQNPGNEPGSQ